MLGATLRGPATSPAVPGITYLLIALNVLVYLATSLSPGGSLVSSQGRLFTDWVMQPAIVLSRHEYYRLLTAAFLHLSPLHILLNMWALYVVGSALEPVMGRLRFLVTYLTSALGGSVAVLVFGAASASVAGASGAIFGLFAAALVLSKLTGVFAFRPLLITVAINFVFTFSIPGISELGHIGGFVTGLVMMLALLGWTITPERPHRWTDSARSARGQVLSVTAILVVLLVTTATR